MRSSRLQKFIWNGPISENVSLRVISDVAKFHAFITVQIEQFSVFLVDNSWTRVVVMTVKMVVQC